MALNNWDEMVVSSTGGMSLQVDTVSVDLYKNWIYIRDPEAYVEGTFAKPTIMEIFSGELRYRNVSVIAERYKKRNGIFMIAWEGIYPVKEWMAGISMYGFSGDEFVGIEYADVEKFQHRLQYRWRDKYHTFPTSVAGDIVSALEYCPRTNQGDAYLCNELGGEAPATEPGKAGATIFSQLLGDKGEQ